MAITREVQRKRKSVKLLTDPQPMFVSLVDRGANQMPLRVLKRDDSDVDKRDLPEGAEVVKIGFPERATKTTNVLEVEPDKEKTDYEVKGADDAVSVTPSVHVDIHKIAFSGVSRADVQVWLAERGYKYDGITDTGSGFEVEGYSRDKFHSVQEIEMAPGIKAMVGALKDDVDLSEGIARSGELSFERNDWVAWDNDVGVVRGRVDNVFAEGRVPGVVAGVSASSDAPVARIEVYRRLRDGYWEPSGVMVAHRLADIRKAGPLPMSGKETKMDRNVAKKDDAFVWRYDPWLAYGADGKTVADVITAGDDGFPVGFDEVTQAMIVALRNALKSEDVAAVKRLGREYTEKILELWQLFNELKEEGTMADKGDVSGDDVPESSVKDDEVEPGSTGSDDSAVKEVDDESVAAVQNDDAVDKSDNGGLEEILSAITKLGGRIDSLEARIEADSITASDVAGRVSRIETSSQARNGLDDEPEPGGAKTGKSSAQLRLTRNLMGFSGA